MPAPLSLSAMGDYLDFGAGGCRPGVAIGINGTGITKQDRIRERELFRFYRPEHVPVDNDGASPPSSPPPPAFESAGTPPITNNDVTLGALAQLVALRLGVHRAMINVIGRETQYTLVESTKTLDLVNQTTSEITGDESWVGSGGTMHKSLSLCENVVKLPVEALQHPFLIIPDLAKDPTFKDRPYVRGPPHYRFYAGTPLRTARGVVIGALCTFAHYPRTLSETERKFMGTISETIMQHLEMRRAAAERDKVTRMSRGLNAFVEGKNSQHSAALDARAMQEAPSQPVTPMKLLSSAFGGEEGGGAYNRNDEAMSGPQTPPERRHDDDLPETLGTAYDPNRHTQESTSLGRRDDSSETSHVPIEEQFQTTLTRASCLLSEALGLKDGGGVVFYDTMTRVDLPGSDVSGATSPVEGKDFDDWSSFSDGVATPAVFDSNHDSEEARAPILGSLVSARYNENNRDESFRRFSSRMIFKFIKRYPSGRIWEFDEHGVIPSQDEGIVRLDARSRQAAAEREVRQRIEADHLSAIFPGVRSLIFVPLWDANASRHYAGCFAWTTDAMARFSADVEFSFVTAFGNSISAEISRLAAVDADQRKSDFIGSVSHELRSPLHGVLASAEFLAETQLDSFQSTLVNTIDSCGRTLLDTINHVLDFSKINSLRRTWKKNQRTHKVPVLHNSREFQNVQSSGIMSILGSTDVAAITEEVIDSIYAGKIYAKAFSPADITDMNASESQRRDSGQPRWQESSNNVVQVLLDIAPGDYNFVTQPGAIRRIVMNIFGNALKYTEKGSIIVRMAQQRDSNDADGKYKIVLSVKDTGKGISTGYLRTRLYTPFAQENDLAPGTGLGLSIVRNIVTMLRGDISIRSKIGRGTEVRIILPNLVRPTSSSNEKEMTRTTSLDFNFLREHEEQTVVGLYGFTDSPVSAMQDVGRILRSYLEDWCKVKQVKDLGSDGRADIVIVDEHRLQQLEQTGMVSSKTSIIVLCRNPAPMHLPAGTLSRHYFLLKPFGPYKLARTVRKCIEQSQSGISGRPISFPPVLNASIPTVNTDPSTSVSNTANAEMAVRESSELMGKEEGRNGALRPSRPRLTSLSPGLSSHDSRVARLQGREGQEEQARSAVTDAYTAKHTDSQAMEIDSSGGGAAAAGVAATAIASTTASTPASATPGNGAKQDEPAHGPGEETRRNPRILVVDDNRTNLMLLQTFLKKRGFQSSSAMDGGMAVREATSNKYDIIFMDISMPVLNGFEATREIRRHEENIRKQHRRESGGSALRSRPTSRIWQHGSVAMTPSSSQQQNAAQQQQQQQQQQFSNHGLGSGQQSGISNGNNGGSSSSSSISTGNSNGGHGTTDGSDGTGGGHPTLPSKPVTPPISPEEERRDGANNLARSLKPSFIIALTGLASGRDQSEAFSSGVDLYMTKPVSLKEVGRLMDNWMANGGLVGSSGS